MVGAAVSEKHGKSLELTPFWLMLGVILLDLISWVMQIKTNLMTPRHMSNFRRGY
jgi:hypothetical protein